MLKNKSAVDEVASYVEEQLLHGNGNDLLVCAGSRSSMMMSTALLSMWCPDIKAIYLAEPGNPPDAVIVPELSAAGLYSLKEYIYTGKTSTVFQEDALIINEGGYSGHFVDITSEVEQLLVVREAGVQAGQLVLNVDTAENNSSKQVKIILLKSLFEREANFFL